MATTRLATGALAVLMLISIGSGRAYAQLGALVSPGRLSQPHQALEGIGNCLQCHSAGRRIGAEKCLACHKPVAERIARKKGVHRAVTTDCVTCHVEHAGVDGELRPFDQRQFDHAGVAGFALDGKHAALAANCAACHKTRSLLAVSPSCASCHADTHKGSLGPDCSRCHTTSITFTETKKRFDHAATAFALTGAHAGVACTSCHRNGAYTGLAFDRCKACHTDVHRQKVGGVCESCHTTQAWKTTKIDHAKTAFPLRGKHASVACASCHVQPALAVKPKFSTCASCHADPHRGSFKQDCSSCHTETTFQKGAFDHAATRFALADTHAALACTKCHSGAAPPPAPTVRGRGAARAVDFKGLRTECVSCHADVHRGELGVTCGTCHANARTFGVTAFTHKRSRSFFDGQHATLACAQCHPAGHDRAVRVGFTSTADTCVSCHRDVHGGQFAAPCDKCHTVAAPKFAVSTFAHQATRFPLSGKHAPLACEACHKVETGVFPAGRATARRFAVATACAGCHADPHAGQLAATCESCHSTDTFRLTRYTHRNERAMRAFFTGRHQTACAACHKPAAGRVATAIAYRLPTACTTCHSDVHRGALGDRCETCHRP